METHLEGTCEKVIFSNPANNFCVVQVRTVDGRLVVAVGAMPALVQAERLVAEGRWVDSGRWGNRFEVQKFQVLPPEGGDGILRFLSSGVLPGIGEEMARRLVLAFGDGFFDVMETDPQRILEVPGIGRKRLKAMEAAWAARAEERNSLVYLYGLGLSAGVIRRLMKAYGNMAPRVVKNDPYRLVRDVWGIGFLTADNIGRAAGVARDDPKRVGAGVLHLLTEASGAGHTFLPAGRLEADAAEFLGVPPELVSETVAALVDNTDLVAERIGDLDCLYLPALARAEEALAAGLRRLRDAGQRPGRKLMTAAIAHGSAQAGVELTEAQELALRSCLEKGLTIITGGPGTGKTTILKAVVAAMEKLQLRVALCAPTGRAAKRMSEASGIPAKTIHRLLEFDPHLEDFGRNEDRPLDQDAVIVDEVSMIDLQLMSSLVEALRPDSRLILVGDKHQLQSVGPGSVLRDLIACGLFPVVTLDVVHRQAARSSIVRNSHRVLQGQELVFDEGSGDLFFVERDDPVKARDTIVNLLLERIPRTFSLDPVDDVQVITPMYKGELGADSLNRALQAALNPDDGQGLKHGSTVFRRRDKVMQVRNNYEKEVFNGDIGRVLECMKGAPGLLVDFAGRRVLLENDELDDLVLGYAVTVHKAQGSEYPGVLLVIHSQHHVMLKRNLLYTALTRGRKLAVIVGRRSSLARALGNDLTAARWSGLEIRLRDGLPSKG